MHLSRVPAIKGLPAIRDRTRWSRPAMSRRGQIAPRAEPRSRSASTPTATARSTRPRSTRPARRYVCNGSGTNAAGHDQRRAGRRQLPVRRHEDRDRSRHQRQRHARRRRGQRRPRPATSARFGPDGAISPSTGIHVAIKPNGVSTSTDRADHRALHPEGRPRLPARSSRASTRSTRRSSRGSRSPTSPRTRPPASSRR